LLQITPDRGYVIPAIDTDSVDYLSCAIRLAKSIKEWHPEVNISVISTKRCSDPVFDQVIPLPHGDLGGYVNDWQVFAASPYRETIKLEADMIAASPIDHWWALFENRDVVISQGCRDIFDKLAASRFYRKIFDNNNLPDVYNAITYWRRSTTAKEFFDLVRNIFENWSEYKRLLKLPDDSPTTDVVYGIAAVIMGEERVTLPKGLGPTIVHMKKNIINAHTEDWRHEFVWENTRPGLRLDTVAQWGFVHYHQKEWVNE
jgi:hypothetical protein